MLDSDGAWVARVPMDGFHLADAALDRLGRPVARHVEFGKTEAAARRWIDEVDEPNARAIAARRDLADVLVHMPISTRREISAV